MATTTVRKGAHRATARAKQAKHAQRTSLPGDGASAPDNLDSLGLPELKQLARAQRWPGVDRATKSVLIDALRKHPGGAPADAAPLADNTSNGNGSKRGVKVSTTQSTENPGVQLGQRIASARENGFSRKDIADASGLTQSVVWRIQAKGFVKPLEVDKITGALDQIEAGQIEPTRRGRPRGETAESSRPGTRAALQSKLDKVHEVLSEVPMNSNKPSEYREAITKALDVIDENA